MKYVIPRNTQVPDPTFQDIIDSGAVIKNQAGHATGDRVYLYRGSDPRLPKPPPLPAVPLASLFQFTDGMIYLPDEAESYFKTVVEIFRAGVAFTAGELAGGLAEAAIGQLPFVLEKLIGDTVEDAVYPEKEAQRLHVEELVKRGAKYLAGVQLVEVEDQIISRGFLRKDEYRLHLTYEQLNGERVSYTFQYFPPKAPKVINAFVCCAIITRRDAELGYLVRAIKAEQFNAEPLFNSYIEKYQSRYGKEWPKHVKELITDVNKEANEELERQGFTSYHINAKVLERLGPLIPYYREVPYLNKWLGLMEEMAATQPASVP